MINTLLLCVALLSYQPKTNDCVKVINGPYGTLKGFVIDTYETEQGTFDVALSVKGSLVYIPAGDSTFKKLNRKECW